MVQKFKFYNFNSEIKICNVPSSQYLTEVDFAEVIEPDGYFFFI